ncbi:kinase-like domain-containing protein [Biscogniauxia marginata]|nr:kinase-like domain-containing protein [Biscogniauxia marginata]
MANVNQGMYRRQRQQQTYQFGEYRVNNNQVNVAAPMTRPLWQAVQLPTRNSESAIEPNIMPWVRQYFEPGADFQMLDQAQSKDNLPDRMKEPWERIQDVKAYLRDYPDVTYRRCLGFGGQGVVVLCRYTNPNPDPDSDDYRDFVFKAPLDSSEVDPWVDWATRLEQMEMEKLARAAHCVQAIPREEVGLPPKRDDQPKGDLPMEHDSEDAKSGSSSNDDSDDGNRPPPPAPRSTLTRTARRNRRRAWALRLEDRTNQWEAFTEAETNAGRPHRDYILLEYLRNGSLKDLIVKIQSQNKPAPNRVLWSFWLCLVRACIGLEYWPRKFHPDRHAPLANGASRDLLEDLPLARKRWRRKRTVHFDIDPKNILIGDITPRDPEHRLIPKLKMADFGLALDVKSEKRAVYYNEKRPWGKRAFFAPEQFGNKWDTWGIDPDSDEIAMYLNRPNSVGANYGSAMNIWGIGLVMFSLITACMPPLPPQPRRHPYLDVGPWNMRASVISYGTLLLDHEWDHVDLELRAIVIRCLAHNPGNRPRLNELRNVAVAGQRRFFEKETDNAIENWIRDMGLHNREPSPSPSPAPQNGGNNGGGNNGGDSSSSSSSSSDSSDNNGGGDINSLDDNGDLIAHHGPYPPTGLIWGRNLIPADHRIARELWERFPHGYRVPHTDIGDFEHGFSALRTSLSEQLGGNTINMTGLPTKVYFRRLYQRVLSKYTYLNNYTQSNMLLEQLGAIIYEWGRDKHVDVMLVCRLDNDRIYGLDPPSDLEPERKIWIDIEDVWYHNPVTNRSEWRYHYRGMTAAAPVVPEDLGELL